MAENESWTICFIIEITKTLVIIKNQSRESKQANDVANSK